MNLKQHWIYVCSDSKGETADTVAKATVKQFQKENVQFRHFTFLQDEEEIRSIVHDAATKGALIIYTLVQPELREMMRIEVAFLNVQAVDVMGPAMKRFVGAFHETPQTIDKASHLMDEHYYRRIEAIEYAVRNDDGKNITELPQADIILLGVSRTSKTPLSIYLAHKGFKTANIPIVPEVKPPDILKQLPSKRLIGLTMDESLLVDIRKARLNDLGLNSGAIYSNLSRVTDELNFARQHMETLGCYIIDVTNRAIEETSEIIMDYIRY